MMLHVALAVLKVEINPMWILCDNKSTVDIFKNKQMITNIRKTKNLIWLKGIEGNTIQVDKEGDLLGYGTVYYNEKCFIFFQYGKKFKSLKNDNNERDAFVVMRDDG